MTEIATREFISEWAYDHGQDRTDARVEADMQCIGADRVAELLRQRHERRLDENFDVIDFETRAAAIDAHFLQAPQARSPGTERKSPQSTQPTRVRPRSASLARRCDDTSSSKSEIPARQRPQSAKYRSEVAQRNPNVGHVDWNASAQEKPSKWREMLAYGPEFKQLTLRKLELETYELLYKTLDQRQKIDVKPTRRRRRRANTGNTATPNDCSMAPACGSGLHLARSRKKRQQEHDRRMMLGRGRQNARKAEQDKSKGVGEDKQAIQDKTRRRNKLLNKKESQRQLREHQPDNHTAKQEKQPEEACLKRQTSAQRTNRMPWIPSGSLSSLAIRGISSETSGLPVTQEQRIAQVLDAFQSHAKTHLRLSKHIQKQLQKAQRCAKTAVARESRKTEQTVKHYSESEYCVKNGYPASASKVIERVSDESINQDSYVCRGNQEEHEVEMVQRDNSSAPLFVEAQPVVNEDNSILAKSSTFLRLVIPPLKLPPNLWEYQLSGETLDEDIELCQGQPVGALEDISAVALSVVDCAFSTSQMKPENPKTNSTARDESAFSTQTLRRPTVEDMYLAEGNLEQASARSSGCNSDSPLVPRQQLKGMMPSACDADDDYERNELANQEMVAAADPLSGIGIHTPRSQTQAENAPRSPNAKNLFCQVEGVMHSPKEVSPRSVLEDEAKPFPAEHEAFVDTVDLPGSSFKNTGAFERTMLAENDTSDTLIEMHGTCADSAINAVTHSRIDGELDLARVGAGGEHEDPGDSCYKTATIVHEEDAKSSSPVVAENPKLIFNSMLTPVSSSADCSVARSCLDPLLNSHIGDDQDFNIGEKQYHPTPARNTILSPSAEFVPALHYQPPPLEVEGSTLLTDSVSIEGGGDIVRTILTKTTANLSANEEIQLRASIHGCGEQDANDGTTALSRPPSQTKTRVLDVLNVVPATSIVTPSTATDKEQSAVEMKSDLATEGSRSAVKKVSRSPKRKPKKPKDPVSGTASPKRSANPKSDQRTSSQPSATDASNSIVSQSEPSSAEDHGKEDPLRVHQQEVTRSFLKRISSRKVVEPEPAFIQSQPSSSSKEHVGNRDELGSAEAVAAKTVLVAMDVEESNVKPVKECRDHDGALLEPDRPSDYESTVENHSVAEVSARSLATTTDVATTPATEKIAGAIAGFTGAVDDGSTSSSTVMENNTKALKGSVVDTSEHEDKSHVLPGDDRDNRSEHASDIFTDTTQLILERHHRAAHKIQAQYRCFVRRRTILDQLRFVVAKQRREMRRKSRVKTKRAKDVVLDTIAAVPVSEHECRSMEMEVKHASSGSLSEQDRQVAQITTNNDVPVGIEMSAAAPWNEEGEPSEEGVIFAARKDSSEYVFDLFDDSNQESRESMREGATGHVEEVADKVSAPNLIGECSTSSENLVDQQNLYAALSEKDVVAVNIANASVSYKPLQREEEGLDEQCVLASSGLGVETSTQQPVGVGLMSSMLLAELAFADDVEVVQTEEADAALEEPRGGLPLRWERYMDGATNKSFYYNPATNETQWINPEANAGINSIDTPTTPHGTANATGVKDNSETQSKTSLGLWQEFLDEASGQLYYYNTQTGECSWEAPAAGSDAAEVVVSPQSGATAETAALGASPWIMYIDPASQAPYYVNVETLATTWEQPEDFGVAASAAVVTTEEVASAGGAIEDAYVIALDDHAGVEI